MKSDDSAAWRNPLREWVAAPDEIGLRATMGLVIEQDIAEATRLQAIGARARNATNGGTR